MSVRPLEDRILVKPLEAETKTASGIFLPESAKEKPMQGKIVAVGPGKRNDSGELSPLDVKSGDTVIFGKWSGTEVTIDGQDLLIMNESDIMGILDKGASKKKAA